MECVRGKKTYYVVLEGGLSIAGNIFLFGLKLWAGMVTGSIALTADAWHTLSDSFSSGIVLFSGWLGSRPADEKHPFGHGRIDLVSSVIIGVLLAVVGLEFVFKAIEQLQGKESVTFGRIAVSVTIISIVGKEVMAQFAFWAARRTGNPMLRADAWHHRTDSLSSVIVLIGILCSDIVWWVDGGLGIVVSGMIFYASGHILKDSVTRLIGERPEAEMLEHVKRIIQELDPDMSPHHFHLHRYGEHCELTFHIWMDESLTLTKAHEKAHAVEKAIRDEMGIEATIHMEPETRQEIE